MKTIVVDDPEDRSFPFCRETFEELEVLYHGTWSTYTTEIERRGLSPGNVPFSRRSLQLSWRQIARSPEGRFLPVFLVDPK